MGMTGSSSNGNSRRTLSEINVTPLVDVMLVLLIMFMVTVPMMQQGIDVSLPETKPSGVEATEEPLTLTIEKNGALRIGEASVDTTQLGKKLKAIMGTRKNKQVYIRADKSVDYGRVAEVMAEIRASGIYSIGLITVPKSS